jgi:uncharacterized protein (TIGR03032 family)
MTDRGPLASVHTSNLPGLLRQLGCSLVVSTYQAGNVILVRGGAGDRDAGTSDVLNTHFRRFDRPMGVCEKAGALAVGGTNTVWTYRNVPGAADKLEPTGKHDACFVPRGVHYTGNIDIHEMEWAEDGRLWLVNTRFSCLCTLDDDHSFHPRWRPPFVSAYAPEDRCHLNGLAMRDGRPRYVTALGETDSMGGWRANKASGGALLDVDSGEVLLRGLSMPHSPRWYRDRLWVLESGRGSLSVLAPGSSTLRTVATLPGFTRGLDFVGPLAFVGLSKVRESSSFSGLPIVRELTERICGVWVVHVESGEVLGFLRFEAGVEEIFAVLALQGTRHPELLMPDDPLIGSTYVLPDAALAEVVLPTKAQLEASPHAWLARGVECFRQHRYAQAIAAFRECLSRQPDFPDARYDLGVALAAAGEYTEALEHLRWACEREPDRSEVHVSLGSLHQRMGQYEAARQAFEAAIARRPDDAFAHASLGILLLQLGEYHRGFEEYEWRRGRAIERHWHGPHPDWTGEPAPDQTLLLDAERTDARHLILLSRYLPALARQVRRLVVQCPQACASLIATVPGVADVRGPGKFAVAEFDAKVEPESLPRLFRTTVTSVPPSDAGLDLTTLRRRASRLADTGRRPGSIYVGLAGPEAESDEHGARDAGVMHAWFESLRQFEDVVWHDVRWPPADDPDLAELALTVAGLDLVLGVDSAAVHVAGALRKPVWALLPGPSDWCWPVTTDQSPWYPTARLFGRPPSTSTEAWLESVRRAFARWRLEQ